MGLWALQIEENFHFEDEEDLHMSSKIYEESDYRLNLDLLIISYASRV